MHARRSSRPVVGIIAAALALMPVLAAFASDGSFYPHPVTPTFGSGGAVDVALGDIDGDGDLDAIVSGEMQTVWLNNGSGTFTPHPDTPSFGDDGITSYEVVLGDIDGDGDLDAVVTNFSSASTVWLNDGTGAYSAHPTTPSFGGAAAMISLGDLDGDGDLDVINALGLSDQNIWLNDGLGSFTIHPTAPSLGNFDLSAYGVNLGDIDNDGDLDVVAAQYGSHANVWLNDGDGVFSPHPTAATFGTNFSVLNQLGDLDNDGDLDAIMAVQNGYSVWLNDGGGIFSAHSGQTVFGEAGYLVFALGDLDGDNDLDLIAPGYYIPNAVWMNDGTGFFTPHPLMPTFGSGEAHSVTLGDIDNDGDLDALVSLLADQTVSIWTNGSASVNPTIVGDGTAGSCTEAAFAAAVAVGGAIAFDCGGTPTNPVTIPITSEKPVTLSTSIDGGSSIILNGGGTTRILAVNSGVNLSLNNITLSNGYAINGGAVTNQGGMLRVVNSHFEGNHAVYDGGAIASQQGSVAIIQSTFDDNEALVSGGAIWIMQGSSTSISGTTFENNQAAVHGGAIMLSSLNTRIVNSSFTTNLSVFAGGALYVQDGSMVTVADSSFRANESDYILDANMLLGGAAIRNEGNLRVERSTFANNIGQFGGAILSTNMLAVIDCQFTQNSALADGGAFYIERGQATIEHTQMTGNLATGAGGAVANFGLTTISDSTLMSNVANGLGGGIYASSLSSNPPSTLTSTIIERTTLEDNKSNNGGGLFANAPVLISESALIANLGTVGGGIDAGESSIAGNPTLVTIKNSTLSGNTAYVRGGGIHLNASIVIVAHSTITKNELIPLPEAGGLAPGAMIDHLRQQRVESRSLIVPNTQDTSFDQPFAKDDNGPTGGAGVFVNGILDLMGSIVANNASAGDCLFFDGEIISGGNNLDGDGSCSLTDESDQPGVEPGLAELARNGGPTQTHALLAGSPAIDSGATNCSYTNTLDQPVSITIDQRGRSRSQGAACDIGAFEALQISGVEGSEISLEGVSDPSLGSSPTYQWSVEPADHCAFTTPDTQHTTIICDDNVSATVTQLATSADPEVEPVILQLILVTSNVEPSLDASGLQTPIAAFAGPAIAFALPWTDPGRADSITCHVDWGDGSSSVIDGGSGGTGACLLSHSYTGPGSFTISVRAIDDDGGASASLSIPVQVAASDPALVLGFGWVPSPAGSYTAKPTATGGVIFLLTVQSRGGSAQPTGMVILKLSGTNQILMSNQPKWMVKVGNRVQIHGIGKVGAVTGYTYTITAADSGLFRRDQIRIQIWDPVGAIVYDNRAGSPESITQTSLQNVGGGGFTIIG